MVAGRLEFAQVLDFKPLRIGPGQDGLLEVNSLVPGASVKRLLRNDEADAPELAERLDVALQYLRLFHVFQQAEHFDDDTRNMGNIAVDPATGRLRHFDFGRIRTAQIWRLKVQNAVARQLGRLSLRTNPDESIRRLGLEGALGLLLGGQPALAHLSDWDVVRPLFAHLWSDRYGQGQEIMALGASLMGEIEKSWMQPGGSLGDLAESLTRMAKSYWLYPRPLITDGVSGAMELAAAA